MSSGSNNNVEDNVSGVPSSMEEDSSSSSIHESYRINDSDSDEDEEDNIDNYDYAQSQDLLEVRIAISFSVLFYLYKRVTSDVKYSCSC